jgi:hypothetical protein
MGTKYEEHAAESKGLTFMLPIFSKIAATYAQVVAKNATTAKVADIDGFPIVFRIQNFEALLSEDICHQR